MSQVVNQLSGFGVGGSVYELSIGATSNANLRTLANAASPAYGGEAVTIIHITGTIPGTVASGAAVRTGVFAGYLLVIVESGGWPLGNGGDGGGGLGGIGILKDQDCDIVVMSGGRASGGGNGGINGDAGGSNDIGGKGGCTCCTGCSTSGGTGGGGAGGDPVNGATTTTPGSGSAGSGSCACGGPSSGIPGTALGTNKAIEPNGFGGTLTNNGTIDGATT